MGYKLYMVMYFKNLVLLLICACLVVSLLDTAILELKALALIYVELQVNLQVLVVLGLAAVPAILTKWELDLINSLLPRSTGVIDVD